MNGTGDGGADNKGEIKVIVRTLAVLAVLCVIGLFVLIVLGREIPSELWLLSSNIATALTAMLVKTSPTPSAPPPTESAKPIVESKASKQKLETTP